MIRYLLPLLLLSTPAFAQFENIPTLGQRLDRVEAKIGITDPWVYETPEEAAKSVKSRKIDREQIASLILEATKQSNLRPLQKNRIERVMNNPWRSAARERMIDKVTSNLLAANAIEVTPEGTYAAIDITAIIKAIEKWLPLLLQLLTLFGL